MRARSLTYSRYATDTVPMTTTAARGSIFGALALATETVDDILLGTAHDVHSAVTKRVHTMLGVTRVPSARGDDSAHGHISRAVYGGLRAGLRATTKALHAADKHGLAAAPLEATPRGRFVVSAVNGLIGDKLAKEGSNLAIEMGVRVNGADVPLETAALAEAFPSATPDLVVFMHGLSETEHYWDRRRHETDGTYGERLERDLGWTPIYLRANTGLPIAENGVALASLLDRLVDAWPSDVRRIALVGHSMGGLIMRAACAVVTEAEVGWHTLVTNVVTLGSPHLGAPIERGLYAGARVLGALPESAPFGRILEYRSVGILDLRAGLAPDVQNLPNAKYHLVGATVAGSPRHPASEVIGDGLVRYPSATGKPRRGVEMFPGADTLHVRGDHFDLLNHPTIYDALRNWLV